MTHQEPPLIETEETEVQPGRETAQASEQVLGKDWLNPLEDEAWKDL
jgi:hypothetical protein